MFPLLYPFKGVFYFPNRNDKISLFAPTIIEKESVSRIPQLTLFLIARTLKLQFAGLFQNLLAREASLSDSKVAFDLQQSSDALKTVIDELRQEKEAFFGKFEGTVFAGNAVMQVLRKHLGIKHVSFFLKDDNGLDEFMELLGFECVEVDDFIEDHPKYERTSSNRYETITAKAELFDDEGNIKNIRSIKTAEENLIYDMRYQEIQFLLDDDAQLPF